MSAACAQDYAWLRETQPDLAEAFCVSYIKGVAKTDALCRLGVSASSLRSLPLADALDACLCNEEEPPQTAHAKCVDGWAVVLEPSGCRAAQPEIYRELSAGTELVSVRVRLRSRYEFRRVVDGVLTTCLDTRYPAVRRGTRSDELVDAIRAVGLDPEAETSVADPCAAALALAERVTGVRIRPEHLDGHFLGAELRQDRPLTPR